MGMGLKIGVLGKSNGKSDSDSSKDEESAREEVLKAGREAVARKLFKAFKNEDEKAFAEAMSAFLELRF